jgi:hypothetical protein
VSLNNDTVVTDGWLEGLIACARHDWPRVGLVGAVTNCGRPPQQVAVDYSRLEDLPDFAARSRRAYAGKALLVERLTGFCLLARHEVLDRLGGLDERFGPGFFEAVSGQMGPPAQRRLLPAAAIPGPPTADPERVPYHRAGSPAARVTLYDRPGRRGEPVRLSEFRDRPGR